MRWWALIVAWCGCYQPSRALECTITCADQRCPAGLSCGDDQLCYATVPCFQQDAGPLEGAGPDGSCAPSQSDLDGDCVPDTVDACIAPAADGLGDLDGDGHKNGVDPCPWDATTTTDVDGDQIPRPCDPFPDDTGDQQRCVMAWSDPGLTQKLWVSRNGDDPWQLSTAHAITGVGGTTSTAAVVAAQSLEGANATTYDVVVTLRGTMTGGFIVWVRAGATPSSNDIGCELTGQPLTLDSRGQNASAIGEIVGTVQDGDRVRIQAMFAPANSGHNLRCVAQIVGGALPVTVVDTITPSGGNVGFSVQGLTAEITGLVIYDRAAPIAF